MKNIYTTIVFLLVFSYGNSQELMNFYLSPNTLTSETNLTLHTTFFSYSEAEFTGYEYSIIDNVLTVSLCYNLSSTIQQFHNRQYLNITIPSIDDDYTLIVNLYSNSNGNSCDYTNLIDTGTSDFILPYNPTQTTIISDDNFEAYMEYLSYGDGTSNNNKVFTHRIENLTRLIISYTYLQPQGLSKIESLNGIEEFESIRTLNVNNNLLTSVDISNNPEMVWFICSDNPIVSLDFSSNPNLKTMSCGNPILNSLNISNNTLLEDLKIFDSNLSILDLSNNINLEVLTLFEINLTELNLTNNTSLKRLDYIQGLLNEIDLSNNTLLEYINLSVNNLTTIDFSNNTLLEQVIIPDNEINTIVITDFPLLTRFNASGNYFDSLDLSSAIILEDLMLLYNSLTYLNLKNGNNKNMDLLTFYNEFPLCIVVDDVNEAPYPEWTVSGTTTFSEDCSNAKPIYILNNQNKSESIKSIYTYPNPVKDVLNIGAQWEIESVKIYSLQGQLIKEGFGNKVDVSKLNPGFYFAQITIDRITVTKKFIKK